ncbi:MAG: hypothetical protein M1827_007074 [Pycnora praestabilis]|nr:MAG: hypothetical protein M1827_007074 [Pycnora praestabilis]
MASSKIFSLEGKGLKLDTAADTESHLDALRNNDTVEEIRLGGNTLGVEACKLLASVLETKKTLQVELSHTSATLYQLKNNTQLTVGFSNIQIANLADIFTSRLLSEIPLALSSLLTALLTIPTLHTINLSDNAFGLNTQAPLVHFLSQHMPLRHLILNNNGLGPNAGTLIANALKTLAQKKDASRKEGHTDVPPLETVICGRNRLENGSMSAWATAFAAHNEVREVKMVQNGIRQEGISHLLHEGLRHATGLRVLDLQDNTFTVIGARALADVVPNWQRLSELGVGDCLLSARGSILVANALSKGHNKTLEVLRLQYNDIDAKGLAAFATANKNALPSLRRIELNGNKFSEEDPAVDELRELLETRRKEVEDEKDSHREGVNAWGLDTLSDLEDEDSESEHGDGDGNEDEEEEEEEEEREEEDGKGEKILQEADEAEAENVPQQKDKGVDELADQLSKTELK